MTRPIVVASRALPIPEHPAFELRTQTPGQALPEGARVYLCAAIDPVSAALIEQFPDSLKLISNIGVGMDNVDLAAASSRGIAVTNTPVVTEDTADLTFALILAACRQVGAAERFVRDGQWGADHPIYAGGSRVHGKTLGIIGFGSIGQAVARRASGFQMPVLYSSRTRRPDAEVSTGAHWLPSVEALVEKADIVSVHAPLTPETQGLIDGATLRCFKRGAVLVNTSRGALVDEMAVAEALENGTLAAAGLDVFEREPEIHAALMARNDVVLTPHMGSATNECRVDMVDRAVANVVAYLSEEELVDRVN